MNVIENETNAQYFAFDGCHKIYLLSSDQEVDKAVSRDYQIWPIDELPYVWINTCPLRFIDSWDLKCVYIPQFSKADFMGWCLDNSVVEEIECINEMDCEGDTVYRIVRV